MIELLDGPDDAVSLEMRNRVYKAGRLAAADRVEMEMLEKRKKWSH